MSHQKPKAPRPGTVEATVLDYLKTGHSIDIPKAQALFGYIQLPSAIFKLRKKGWPIITQETKAGPLEKSLTTYVLPKKVTFKMPHMKTQKQASPVFYRHGLLHPLVVRQGKKYLRLDVRTDEVRG